MGALRTEPTIGDLLSRLATDGGELARQELRLASFELIDRAKDASGKVGLIALGGGLAHAGLLGLLTAATIGLAYVIPFWAAALIMGVVFLGIGVFFVLKGLKALRPPTILANPTSSAPQLLAVKDGHR